MKLAALLDWLAAHIDEELSIADIARQADMRLRTFQRRFREATGTAPGDRLIRQRVARARYLAETTDLSVEHVLGYPGAPGERGSARRLIRERTRRVAPKTLRELDLAP